MTKRTLLLVIIALLLGVSASARTFKAGDKPTQSEKWIQSKFLRSSKLPFSFCLDGKHSDGFIHRWKRELTPLPSKNQGENSWLLTITNPERTLKVKCEIYSYSDFEAVEWTLRFENCGKENSARISDIKAADILLSPKSKSDFTLHTAQGCHAKDIDFHALTIPVKPGETIRHQPAEGRSSSVGAFPFYNISTDEGCGFFLSIGWSGNWYAEFNLDKAKNLTISSGLPTTDLFLYPGEEVRSPRISLLFWEGKERIDGNNTFRRFVLAHHTPRTSNGEIIKAPLCMGFDFGDPAPCGEYEALTELLARAVVERCRNFEIMPEVFWLDAGWYKGCNAPSSREEKRSWYNTAGSWEADPVRFPNGLKPIADDIHAAGAKFMVWLEPERVYEGSTFDKQYPQWLLKSDKNPKNRLFNLGEKEALDFLCKYVGDFFEQNGIDYYRQDFNFNPSPFWEAADGEQRKGVSEMHYIEGLYKYWDYLLERFPDMVIDNCASGGRRLDLETISRSIPLWRTDCHYGEPTCQQCHEYGLSQFLPLHGTGVYASDSYHTHSGLSSAYAWLGEVFSKEHPVPTVRALLATYKEIRNYYLADFYPLSGDGDITGKDIWVAWQFHDPATNSGIIQAFRRDEAKESSNRYQLSGIDEQAQYELYDMESKQSRKLSGKELAQEFEVELDKPRSSKLLRYKMVE